MALAFIFPTIEIDEHTEHSVDMHAGAHVHKLNYPFSF